MNFENIKISGTDVIKLIGFVTVSLGQYYAFKSEIKEQFMVNSFHNQTTDAHFERLETSDKLQTEKLNLHDIKLARIFTMIYRDADKPKETKIETEE